jgi:hypothetical protein
VLPNLIRHQSNGLAKEPLEQLNFTSILSSGPLRRIHFYFAKYTSLLIQCRQIAALIAARHNSRPVCFDKATEGEMERGGGDYVLCVLTRTDMEGVGVITHSRNMVEDFRRYYSWQMVFYT